MELIQLSIFPLTAADDCNRSCVWMTSYSPAELLRGKCMSLFFLHMEQVCVLPSSAQCACQSPAFSSPTGSTSMHLTACWAGFSWQSRYRLLEQLQKKIMLRGNPFAQGQLQKGLGFWFFFPKFVVWNVGLAQCSHFTNVPPTTPGRLLHAALCIMAGKCKQFQYRFPGSYDVTKAAFQCEFPGLGFSLMWPLFSWKVQSVAV